MNTERVFCLQTNVALALAAYLALAPCFGPSPPYSLGRAVSALVVGWNSVFATCCSREMFAAWRFCATLSVFLVLPDALLVRLGSLEFPNVGVPLLPMMRAACRMQSLRMPSPANAVGL